ncbi:hypothetical protein [Paenibacillus tyrfis]|uniref:Uncharacterized protein n=1 Tax=Paenibacillus tyrfis TaxID=1501230 RepID=A0A081NW67_9BACL|nr:hypothetical protein [Paenibacillus tyrfis]KEQ22690.1 hypothetical protein ET33_22585 [Paenibacillus tyrfis]
MSKTLRRLCLILMSALTLVIAYQNRDVFANSTQVEPQSEVTFSDNLLGVSSRKDFIVCVDNKSSQSKLPLTKEQLTETVKAMVTAKTNSPEAKAVGYGKYETKVNYGCSFSPVLTGSSAKHPVFSGDISATRVTKSPSSESLAIFIVDKSVVDKHFLNTPNRWSPEQVFCEKEECNEVTKGIYLTPEELNELSKLDLSGVSKGLSHIDEQKLTNSKLANEMNYGLGLKSALKPQPNDAENVQKKEAEKLKK